MVKFSVFNELSLPLSHINEFEDFFKVLSELKNRGLNKMRTDRPFTQYTEILPNTTFQKLLGQISDRNKKRRLQNFINSNISIVESPLIKDEEIEDNEEAIENIYSYKGKDTFDGLAYADIWNTIAVSFNSHNEWDNTLIRLENNKIDVDIKHASKVEHLTSHQSFFEQLEEENKQNITQENFWERQKEFFPNKILFCKEIEKQIQKLDKNIFEQAISMLRDIETGKKMIRDYSVHPEKVTVKTNPKMRNERMFIIDEEKVFFENHITSLPNGNRLYFLERHDKIYIGYIGKHLPTKKFPK